jgi:hypothetical protein
VAKTELAPGLVGVVKEGCKNRARNRNRVRLELSPTTGRWLLDRVAAELKTIDIDDPQFKDVYTVYKALSDQIGFLDNPK